MTMYMDTMTKDICHRCKKETHPNDLQVVWNPPEGSRVQMKWWVCTSCHNPEKDDVQKKKL